MMMHTQKTYWITFGSDCELMISSCPRTSQRHPPQAAFLDAFFIFRRDADRSLASFVCVGVIIYLSSESKELAILFVDQSDPRGPHAERRLGVGIDHQCSSTTRWIAQRYLTANRRRREHKTETHRPYRYAETCSHRKSSRFVHNEVWAPSA
jgi:hypothetical protein